MDSLRQVDTEPLIPLERTISKTFKKENARSTMQKSQRSQRMWEGIRDFFFFFLNGLKKYAGGESNGTTGSQHRPLKPA